MHIDIDQSGRIETLTQDSALGFSNSISYGIYIPRKAKRHVLAVLQERYKEGHNLEVRIFAAGLFLLIRDHLSRIQGIVIDLEYPGHEATIKGMLLRHVRRVEPRFDKKLISFKSIGKKSGAHYKAYGIYSGKQEPDRIVTAEELLSLL